MRITAGTDAFIDILVFQKRSEGTLPHDTAWIGLREVDVCGPADCIDSESLSAAPDSTDAAGSAPRDDRRGIVMVNEYFVDHTEMVLGTHAQRRGIYGSGLSYTCRAMPDAGTLEEQLDRLFARLPRGVFTARPNALETDDEEPVSSVQVGRAADGAPIKEGSYHTAQADGCVRSLTAPPFR